MSSLNRRHKLKEVDRGKLKGSIHIPTRNYYQFIGFLESLNYYLMNEIGREKVEYFKLREIILSLAIMVENGANTIFKAKKIKPINKLCNIIKKLKELKYIDEDQKIFLDDFRELRNSFSHELITSKISFRKKSLMTRMKIINLVVDICKIINTMEEKSASSSGFNHLNLYKLMKDQAAEMKLQVKKY